MSSKYPGGIISKTAPTPSGPYSDSTAPGVWTLEQQAYWQKLGQWPIPGNVPLYIEDVFSTYVWAGTGNQLSIVNGIDLSTKGGMVWIKNRTSAAYSNQLFDTVRGFTYSGSQPMGNNIQSNSTDAQAYLGYGFSAFNSNGFRVGYNDGAGTNVADTNVNGSGNNYVSWTFREQPKFFDIVTYSGNSSAGREIAHNLGSTPGCIIVKRLDSGDNWPVYHRGISDSFLKLNTTDANAAANAKYYWGNNTVFIAPTSTVFTVATDSSINQTGGTYVAYLFAHNAGGFGLTGTDNVITCGSFTADGSGGATVNLGFEPQWIMYKSATRVINWTITDNMRGWVPQTTVNPRLAPNVSDAESTSNDQGITSTGFNSLNNFSAGETVIYVAIRRGPMKVPTDATTVFTPVARTGNGSSTALTSPNIVTDLAWIKYRNGYDNPISSTRLTGPTKVLFPNSTSAEATDAQSITSFASNVGYTVGTGSRVNGSGGLYINWVFKRAPSFMDIVCYTGTGAALSVTHNLTVAPELIFIKSRTDGSYWILGGNFGASTYAYKNDWGANDSSTAKAYSGTVGFTSQPTSTTIPLSTNTALNVSASNYVMYMWATVAGVSKVGTYTGTGTLTTINCGFTAGARFVLITRVGVTGTGNQVYMWDTARGMVSGTDPSLMLNDSEIEVNANSVYAITTGFQLLASPAVDVNISGASYIFLAIA